MKHQINFIEKQDTLEYDGIRQIIGGTVIPTYSCHCGFNIFQKTLKITHNIKD